MRKRITEKEKKVNPRRYNLRQVGGALAADIMDEEARPEMNKSIKSC